MKKTVDIEGMSCGHCSAAVTKALSAVDGVSDVYVDLEARRATLTASDSVSDAALKEAVEDVGFEVTQIK